MKTLLKPAKSITPHAIAVMRKMRELGVESIRRENSCLWYGNTDWMCLHPSGLIILERRGFGQLRRTPSGMNIEHFQLNEKGRNALQSIQ